MTAKYFAILTNQGAARLANATSLGTKLNITQMAVGDANGILPTPTPAQTALINQQRIAPLNRLSVDANNSSQIIAEQVIPETEGGFWIREIGLYDDEGVLIAVANCPETYKPQMQEGSGRTQTIRMVITVSSTAAVTLKIDPSVVLATRQYADDLMNNHVKAANPHAQYAPLASPAFTGTPTVPDAATGNYGEQIANTKFVHDVLTADNTMLPVGAPIAWPQAAVPAGWFKCNGAAFDKTTYPRLAAAYPTGVLPDLRGEFIRGLDDGRGLDAGRTLLSMQVDDFKNHNHTPVKTTLRNRFLTDYSENSVGALANLTTGGGLFSFSTYTESTGGSETRPHNIAFNYIVRAA